MRKLLTVLFGLLIIAGYSFGQQSQRSADTVAGKCMTCHKEKTTGLYNQWFESAHGAHNVTCIDCHGANRSDVDAYEHEGAYIATLVTPKD